MKYIDFIQQPEIFRLEWEEKLLVSNVFDTVDCQSWTWGGVKDAQDLLSEAPTYKDILDISMLEAPNFNENTEFHCVIGMYNAIRKSIIEISEIEKNALSGTLSPKEMAAIEKVGGFNEFGSIPQTLSLVPILGMSVEQVRAMPWDYCFSVLAYKKKENDFQKEIFRK